MGQCETEGCSLGCKLGFLEMLGAIEGWMCFVVGKLEWVGQCETEGCSLGCTLGFLEMLGSKLGSLEVLGDAE